MLAAESAWRILATEHARLRQWLATIAGVLDSDAWQHRGPQLDLLRRLVREFQDFETQTHRPKGGVLLVSVRGRSVQADELLDALDQERKECERLLMEARQRLEALERAGEADGARIASLMRQHRDLMMRHLDKEDTQLRSCATRLLTPEEWSAVASSISTVVHKDPSVHGKA
jgi:hemerythrin-like domain-containing protein